MRTIFVSVLTLFMRWGQIRCFRALELIGFPVVWGIWAWYCYREEEKQQWGGGGGGYGGDDGKSWCKIASSLFECWYIANSEFPLCYPASFSLHCTYTSLTIQLTYYKPAVTYAPYYPNDSSYRAIIRRSREAFGEVARRWWWYPGEYCCSLSAASHA